MNHIYDITAALCLGCLIGLLVGMYLMSRFRL